MTRTAAFALAAALAVPGFASAQTVSQAQTANVAGQVQGLAPQLVPFAGSTANFQNLVNGLSLGTPISLVGTTADGLQQTATFSPTSPLTAVQIAQTLEQARQALISRGVATPTPEQIGVSLVGGTLPTPAGTVPVGGLLVPATSASTGASTANAATAPAPGLTVTTRAPSTAATTTVGGATVPGSTSATSPTTVDTSATPQVRNTSDSPIVRNTSDSPFTRNTSDTPAPAAIPGALGTPSPAAQIQQRR